MLQLIFSLLLALLVQELKGQNTTGDSAYTTRIGSVEWMPDGNFLLLSVVKHHKINQQAPFYSKVVLYDLEKKNFKSLFEDGSSVSVSPNGETVAYLKRSERNRTEIHFYDIATGVKWSMKVDTLSKFALAWSADGKNLIYNVRKGNGPLAILNICVLNLATKEVRQIIKEEKYKSYSPAPGPDGNLIAYYLEKDDGHDQIWLTDLTGSFYKNLTNDTATHNYYPGWMGDKKIFYTQSPATLMTMDADGSNKHMIDGLSATTVRYNVKTSRFAYIKSEEENKLMLYDWHTKNVSEILDGATMMALF